MMNFPDNPTQGQTFGNYIWDNQKWMPKSSTFTDAPSDDKNYGRKNASWAEIISDVTKAYVDAEIAKTVKKTGDTMTGHLSLPTGPAAANAVRKDYVDAADALSVLKTGSTMSGVLTLSAGGTVPDLAAQNTTQIANTNYVETRASAWGASHAANKLVKSGDTMTGLLTTCKTVGHIAWNSGGSNGIQVIGNENSNNHAILEFHRPNSFACNFGLAEDCNFWMGGWSFGGGNWYKFWTGRDFTEGVTHNVRMLYVGDYEHGINAGLVEPYGRGAAVTGLSGFNNYSSGSFFGRYAQVQVRRSDGYYNCEQGG
jgi:hypothetical protein